MGVYLNHGFLEKNTNKKLVVDPPFNPLVRTQVGMM